MPPWFETTVAASGLYHGQFRMNVTVPFADTAAINHHGVVEQSAIAIGNGFGLLKEVRELLDVMTI